MVKDLSEIKKVYLLGIGGIGVSALARMFKASGAQVSGSDTGESLITEELRKIGVKISIGQDVADIDEDTDLVIYTVAIRDFAKEFLTEVKTRFSNVLSYPEVLGLISKQKKTIAVAGTHGKTTTTAMIAEVLLNAKKDPTVVVGSLLSKYKSNYIEGKSDLFVVEACEYEKSFLELHPFIAVVTNIDNDHLDFYGSIDAIIESFNQFLKRVPKDGFIVCFAEDERMQKALVGVEATIINASEFLSLVPELKVKGLHNRSNASLSLGVSKLLEVEESISFKALSEFTGTWRRFEYKGETTEGAKVYDDYAHHPTEIKATLQGARELCKEGKIFVIFEPHLFSRTKILFNDFVESFKDATKVVILPIYPAREAFDPSISSEMLVSAISNTKAVYEDSPQSAIDYVTQRVGKGDIVITMGAGGVTKISEILVKKEV